MNVYDNKAIEGIILWYGRNAAAIGILWMIGVTIFVFLIYPSVAPADWGLWRFGLGLGIITILMIPLITLPILEGMYEREQDHKRYRKLGYVEEAGKWIHRGEENTAS